MVSSIGIRGKNFVIIAADTTFSRSVVLMKNDQDKFRIIDNRIVVSSTGEQGDSFRTSLFVTEKALFDALENGIELSPKVLAHMYQKRVQGALRERPLATATLVGGRLADEYDLWFVDNYGAIASAPFYANGYASYFVYGIFDREYREDMSVEEGIEILQKCVNLIKERILLDLDRFILKIVTSQGIESRIIMPQARAQ
jgi:20S proteasome subunit beta 4